MKSASPATAKAIAMRPEVSWVFKAGPLRCAPQVSAGTARLVSSFVRAGPLLAGVRQTVQALKHRGDKRGQGTSPLTWHRSPANRSLAGPYESHMTQRSE